MEEAGPDDLRLSEPGLEGIEHTQDEALFNEPGPSAPAPLALYRRYRPDTFAEVIGQEHVTEPLQRALTNNRVNHAYLFSGLVDVARPHQLGSLLAPSTARRVPGPCLVASASPAATWLAMVREASMSSRSTRPATAASTTLAICGNALLAPVSSRFKIYIVDEAHMVTTAGFNALLKLVEEPPPHVKFVFATTEPDKVSQHDPPAHASLPFRLVPPRLLTEYLGKLCDAEGIAVEPAVLPLVVRAGGGSVRDSLSVLDQLLGAADESGVSYRQAAALLGYTPDSLLDEFVDAFAAGDAGGCSPAWTR